MYETAVNGQVISELMESLVIEVSFCDRDRALVLVTDYWNRSPNSDREFLRLQFSGVSDFSWVPGVASTADQFPGRYLLGEIGPVHVVQLAKVRGDRAPFRVRFSFGDLGRLSFTFADVVGRTLATRAAPDGRGGWTYTALANGEEVDFFRPFGEG